MKNRGGYIIFASVILLALTLFACTPAPAPAPAPSPAPAPAPAPAPTKLTALTFQPNTVTVAKWSHEYYQRLNSKSNGQLIIDYRGGPENIASREQFGAAQRGVIDMVNFPATWFVNDMPETAAFNLSRILPWEERAPGGLYDIMVQVYEKQKVRYLGRGVTEWGFVVGTNKLINNPRTDFKGLKFRSVATYAPFFDRLGISGVNLNPSDIYNAMERKLVEGWAIAIPDVVKSYKLQEVTKYWINHPFYQAGGIVVVMNLEKWNKLPQNIQKFMIDTMAETERDMYADLKKINDDSYKVAEDAGMKPIVFSQADADWYLDQAYDSLWELAKKDLSPDMYEKLRKAAIK